MTIKKKTGEAAKKPLKSEDKKALPKKALLKDSEKGWYKEWLPKFNKKRRMLYKTDPAYRQKQLEKSRTQYRDKAGVLASDCRENLAILEEMGTYRPVFFPRKAVPVLTFSMQEAAEALGISALAFYRWRQDGRIPEPVFRCASAGIMAINLYLLAEVRAMVEVIGEHQATCSHYRVSHVETTKKVFEAVKAARKGAKHG